MIKAITLGLIYAFGFDLLLACFLFGYLLTNLVIQLLIINNPFSDLEKEDRKFYRRETFGLWIYKFQAFMEPVLIIAFVLLIVIFILTDKVLKTDIGTLLGSISFG